MNETSRPDLAPILGDVVKAEACAALAMLVESPAFSTAPQLAAFLGDGVNTALAGREGEIKGYTIAVEALGRPGDFDPVIDPIVRVEAGRLRRARDSHSAGEGASDPVRVRIPCVSYVPRFVRQSGEAAPLDGVSGRLAAVAIVPAPASRGEAGPAPASASPPFVTRPLAPRLLLAGLAAVTLVGAGLFWNGQRDRRPESPTDATVEELTSATRQQPSVLVVGMTGSDPSLSAAMLNYDNQLSDALARFDQFSLLKAAPAATTVLPSYRVEHAAQFISSTGASGLVTAGAYPDRPCGLDIER